VEKDLIMPVPISIKLQSDFSSYFQKNVLREITQQLNRNVRKIHTSIKTQIKEAVRDLLFSAPEVTELMGGILQGQLGVVNPTSKITGIIDTWVQNIEVSTVVNKMASRAGPLLTIEIKILRQDYSDVLSLPQSAYESVGSRGTFIIEWLRWLLLEGDRTIANYFFMPGNMRQSRTRLGIMVQKEGRRWSVPPQFRGIATDNFATRALVQLDKTIDKIVEMEVKRVMR
jgi:hypothetical protein